MAKLQKVNREQFDDSPDRYELRSGNTDDAPNCPYGNKFKWIGFDKKTNEYVRFTTSFFKELVKEVERA